MPPQVLSGSAAFVDERARLQDAGFSNLEATAGATASAAMSTVGLYSSRLGFAMSLASAENLPLSGALFLGSAHIYLTTPALSEQVGDMVAREVDKRFHRATSSDSVSMAAPSNNELSALKNIGLFYI